MAGFKTIFRTQITDVASTDLEGVGRLRWEDDKCYRWIQNTITNYTPAIADLVCHTFTDGALALTEISKPATATLGLLAGIVMGPLAANTGTLPLCYGWIQVYGPNSQVNVTPVNTQTTAAPVAGNSLIAVNGATYAATGQAMGTAAVYRRTLELLDSVAGSTTVQACNVLVQCL